MLLSERKLISIIADYMHHLIGKRQTNQNHIQILIVVGLCRCLNALLHVPFSFARNGKKNFTQALFTD